jgi:hypothetical protein
MRTSQLQQEINPGPPILPWYLRPMPLLRPVGRAGIPSQHSDLRVELDPLAPDSDVLAGTGEGSKIRTVGTEGRPKRELNDGKKSKFKLSNARKGLCRLQCNAAPYMPPLHSAAPCRPECERRGQFQVISMTAPVNQMQVPDTPCPQGIVCTKPHAKRIPP